MSLYNSVAFQLIKSKQLQLAVLICTGIRVATSPAIANSNGSIGMQLNFKYLVWKIRVSAGTYYIFVAEFPI